MYFWLVSLVLHEWSHQNGTNTSRCTLVANTEVGRPEAWLKRWVSPSGCWLAVWCKTACWAWAVRMAAPCQFFHWEKRRRLLHESGLPQTTVWDLPFVSTSCFQRLEEKESPVLASFSFFFFPPKCAVALRCPDLAPLGVRRLWKGVTLWLFLPPLRLKSCEIHRHSALPHTQTPLHHFKVTLAAGEGRTFLLATKMNNVTPLCY